MPTDASRPAKRSQARERLLATATTLFYAEGINRVGVDRIIRASHTTTATFYRHFPGKEDLVVAYLQGIHDLLAARFAEVTEKTEGRALVRAIGGDVTAQIGRPDFRGCAFMNAAAEFEDPQSPVRRVVAEHRQWYYQLVRRAFVEAGHPRPGNAARHFVVLRDGSMSAAYLDTATVATRTFTRGVEGLLRSIDVEQLIAANDHDDP